MASAESKVIVRYVGDFSSLRSLADAQTWLMDQFGDYVVESMVTRNMSTTVQFKLLSPSLPKSRVPGGGMYDPYTYKREDAYMCPVYAKLDPSPPSYETKQ